MKPYPFTSIAQQDAEFCGKVPLHQTNVLQPHAYLLVASVNDFTVLQVGENVEHLLKKPVQQVVGGTLRHYFSDQALRQMLEQNASESLPYAFQCKGKVHLASVKKAGDVLFVEIEKEEYDAAGNTFKDVYRDIKHISAQMDNARNSDEVCRIAANELKRISGFDKVMIYRFDNDWNGDVVAEAMEAGMDSYLGLKFPASDIPQQARELYKTTPYRIIPAVDYEPVKLYPLLNPQTQSFTNLSNCNLRSVAGVHLEYLRNMGVQASMSTRILVNGELWGLIACHHRQPFFPGYEICSQFELLSLLISGKIAAMQQQDVFAYKSQRQQLLTALLEDLYALQNLEAAAEKNSVSLLQLLSATGAAVCANHKIVTLGQAPPTEVVEEILFWLRAKNINHLYQNTTLPQELEITEKYTSVAAGLLALPIQPNQYVFVLGFRAEAIKEVSWAGNPYQSVMMEADGKKYHPRTSFRLWQEKVHHTANLWLPHELDIAESLRQAFIEFYLHQLSRLQ